MQKPGIYAGGEWWAVALTDPCIAGKRLEWDGVDTKRGRRVNALVKRCYRWSCQAGEKGGGPKRRYSVVISVLFRLNFKKKSVFSTFCVINCVMCIGTKCVFFFLVCCGFKKTWRKDDKWFSKCATTQCTVEERCVSNIQGGNWGSEDGHFQNHILCYKYVMTLSTCGMQYVNCCTVFSTGNYSDGGVVVKNIPWTRIFYPIMPWAPIVRSVTVVTSLAVPQHNGVHGDIILLTSSFQRIISAYQHKSFGYNKIFVFLEFSVEWDFLQWYTSFSMFFFLGNYCW